MKARVIEMEPTRGWGRAQLEDGRVLPFDVMASAPHLPAVGIEAVVELGPSRLGGEKITRLVPVSQWKNDHLFSVFLRPCSETEAELFVVDTLSKSPHTGKAETRCVRVKVPSPSVSQLEPGSGCVVEVEVDTSAQNNSPWKVRGWRAAPIPGDSEVLLRKAFFEQVVQEWESWNDPDGCHCADCRRLLSETVFLGVDLGLAVKKYLEIRDYPVEPAGTAYTEARAPVTRMTTLTRRTS